MSSRDFNVAKPNDDQIGNHWTWLLSVSPDSNPIYKGIFYMRACYKYIDDIQNTTSPQRINLCDDTANTVGSQSNPHSIPNNVPIFLPLLYTFVHDKNFDENGDPLTPAKMNVILDNENKVVSSGDLNATIENLTARTGEQPIDRDLISYRTYFPSKPDTATFSLTIPDRSALADKLEFAERERITVNVRAQGFFLLLSNITPATYHIRSFCHGIRNHKAFMDYYLQVEKN
jgi:hypothetical protein